MGRHPDSGVSGGSRRWARAAMLALAALAPGSLRAGEACPGNPEALGTSRVVTVDPAKLPYVGTQQYKQTVPLARGEVILTFDDGPLPPMTNRVLEALDRECVKATFFIVGRMASAYPQVLQHTLAAGHTIANHTQSHRLPFDKLKQGDAVAEIEKGLASVNAALGPVGAKAAPFFRFPGLGRTKALEAYTKAHGLAVFSVDLVADDWLHLKPDEVYQRAIDRLQERGSGILLLHDIQPATAVMLPRLLAELKKRNFKVVHVAPPSATRAEGLPRSGDSRAAAAGMSGQHPSTADPATAIQALDKAVTGISGAQDAQLPAPWPRFPADATGPR